MALPTAMLPQHSDELEQQILGELFLGVHLGETERINEALRCLGADAFSRQRHRLAFQVIEYLHRSGQVPDLITTTEILRERNLLDEAGGAAYLTELVGAVYNMGLLTQHVQLLRAIWAKRATAQLAGEVAYAARNGQDPQALIGLLEQGLTSLRGIVFDSFTPKETMSRTNRITAADLAARTGSEPPVTWLPFLRQHGILGRGLATLISAHGKIGKTTTMSHASRPLLTDGLSMLWLTEEPRQVWQDRILRIPDLASPLLTLTFTDGTPWPRMVADLEQEQHDVVIVDTIRGICGIVDENDQAAVTAALQPLIFLTRRKDWALILIHHLRKTAADVGLGHAGSHAVVGLVEVAVEIHRDIHSPTRRVCKAVSRFPATPAEWVMELRNDDLHVLGEPGVLAAAELVRRVEALLDETPRTQDEIADLLDPNPSAGALSMALNALLREHEIRRDGKGVKGHPYRWSRP